MSERHEYTPLRGLANWTILLSGVCVLSMVALVFASTRMIPLLNRFDAADGVVEEAAVLDEIMSLDNVLAGGLGLWFLANLVTGVLWLRWTYMSSKNAHALTTVSLDSSPGWSVGWYFIPFANLWKPYTALREIWEISDIHRGSSALLGWWWCLHIVTEVLFQISSRLDEAATEGGVDDLVLAHQFSIVAYVLAVPNYVIGMMIVHRLTNLQKEKHEAGGQVGGRECQACGEKLAAGARECPVCGARIFEESRERVDFGGVEPAVDAPESNDVFPRFDD